MTISVIQNSFVAGELAPSFLGRTDKPQYKNGASTMRNCFVRYTGGCSSRAGFAYVGMCKQGAPNLGGSGSNMVPPRDIEFQFSINTGFVLEFGEFYMRVKSQGAYVTEAGKNITSISTGVNPAVIGVIAHGYSVGDWVFIPGGIIGSTTLNGQTLIVTNIVDVNHFNASDLFGNIISSVGFPAYVSGGTTARIYTVISPYASVDLPYLKVVQNKNVMTLCLVNQQTFTEYNIYDLQRFGNTNWQFGAVTFTASIGPPSNVKAAAFNSTTVNTNYGYVVTAVDASSGEESVASLVAAIGNNNISINAGSNKISWNAVPGASQYNIYMTTPAFQPGDVSNPSLPFGYIGTTIGTTFTDSNITADFTRTPPLHNDPFAVSGISGATITNGGDGNYTQSNIGYQINTTTGSGAVLQLTVADGLLAGIAVVNQGQNYNPLTDTVTITSGSVNPPVAATGSYTFIDNPTSGKTIVLNGVPFVFGAGHIPIGGTLALTLNNLLTTLKANGNPAITVAFYAISGSVLNIVYKTSGTVGNSYTLAAGTYGGVISGSTLTGGSNGGGVGGTGATAALIFTLPSGNTPSTVKYFQQRRVYANTTNEPDTYFMSKPGAYENMDSAIPTIDSDAIIGAPWAEQVNGIQFMQPTINGLLTFTGNGVWLVNGGNNAAITPSDQNAQAQAQIGCSAIVPPLYVNLHVLYVQAKNSTVRDISFNFLYNVFQGTDITVWANHLFQGFSILQWAYAEEPFKIIWSIRNDGRLLSLTYMKEQEIEGWARHDTNGLFVGICSITEKHQADAATATQFGPLTDAIYAIVQRYIVGPAVWVYYAERMDDRNWSNVEDVFAVDAGLAYPMSYPQATLFPTTAVGTNNITSTILINGGSGYTSPTAVAVDANGRGTGATFSVTVLDGVIDAVTALTGGINYTAGATQIIFTDSTGSGASFQPVITNYVTFNASADVFTPSVPGAVLRADGGKATVVTYNSARQIIANITEPLTNTILNDPNNLPVPVVAGEWTLSQPTSVVLGLNHLEGMIVTGLADGGVIEPVAVINGSIALSESASAIVVGLPFVAQGQTMPWELPSSTTTQGKRGNISSAILRLEASRGVQVGANQPDASMQPNQATLPWTNMDEWKQRNQFIHAGAALPLFSGDTDPINITSEWDERKQCAFQQVYPLPMNILACIPDISMGDPNG